jgi:hypothetical protein
MRSAGRIAEKAVVGASVVVVLGAGVAVVPTMAQVPTASDPPSGSPSGTIYRLPVDHGRQDAAPRGDGDDSAGGLPTSTFRSDNNFGTSSVVPGDPRAGKDGSGSAGDDGAGGTGSELDPLAGTGDTGDTSEPLALILLLVIGAVGAFLGIAASRSARTASH